jgi:hypothetical protein
VIGCVTLGFTKFFAEMNDGLAPSGRGPIDARAQIRAGRVAQCPEVSFRAVERRPGPEDRTSGRIGALTLPRTGMAD